MKHIIILGDGMADWAVPSLGNKTLLQYANTPYMDKLAQMGRTGMLKTVADGFHPGSEVANMSVMGYDLPLVYEGRGVLEAASIGVDLEPGDMAMRCNLITIEDGKIKNHSAGHISNAEAAELIAFLQKELGGEDVNFFPGVSYRHLLKIKGGSKRIVTTPPHDVPGTPYKDVLVRAADTDGEPTARQLNELIERSMTLLENHPVNLARKAAGKDPANSIWPWSPGYRPQMQTLMQRYGIGSGVVISAVDLIKGIGVYAGLESIDVEGATGLYNTNYEGKAQAAIEALRTHDFVFLHIEASDEAGHEGDVALKMKTIEYLDRRIVKPILDAVSTWDEPVSIAILPDHPTPCALRTHTSKPIPFTIYRTNEPGDDVQAFDEFAARKGSYGDLSGDQFMERFILRK